MLSVATVQRGYYFQVGVDPTFAFANFPLTIELPTYVNFPSDNFYQNFGFHAWAIHAELKGTVPLKFIPKGYGNWSVNAGVQYYYLINHGLLDENQVLATSERKRSLWQVHGGLTLVF